MYSKPKHDIVKKIVDQFSMSNGIISVVGQKFNMVSDFLMKVAILALVKVDLENELLTIAP